MQYIRLLLFYSVIFQSVIFSPSLSSPSFSSPANSSHPYQTDIHSRLIIPRRQCERVHLWFRQMKRATVTMGVHNGHQSAEELKSTKQARACIATLDAVVCANSMRSGAQVNFWRCRRGDVQRDGQHGTHRLCIVSVLEIAERHKETKRASTTRKVIAAAAAAAEPHQSSSMHPRPSSDQTTTTNAYYSTVHITSRL